MDQIEVATITDGNYILYQKVAIVSLCKNTSSRIRVNLIYSGVISKKDREFFLNLEKMYKNITLRFINYSNRIDYSAKNHVSKAAYIKINLDTILSDIDKVIYLDSDVLINDDIKELWSYSNKIHYLGAIINPGYDYDNRVFGVSKDHKTFNSGVMMLNLKNIRKHEFSKKLKLFLDEKGHLTRLNDQAAFNAVFLDWQLLPEKWNVQYVFYMKSSKELDIDSIHLKDLRKNPSIIHFTSNSKPWQYRNAHPLKKKYYSYLIEVEPNFKYQDKNILSLVKRIRESISIIKKDFTEKRKLWKKK